MIEYDLIQSIIDATGIPGESIRSIEIDPQGVVVTAMMRVPQEDGSVGPIMLHDGEIMFYKKVFKIHRAGDHVHGDEELDHSHE